MPSKISKPKQKHKWQFEAIGTSWSIETSSPLDDLKSELSQIIDDFDKAYSRFRDDSVIAAISKSAGTYALPENTHQLIDFYQELYEKTGGAVTPLAGNVLDAAGYDKTYSFVQKTVNPAPSWEDVMKWKDGILETIQPTVLDFGAAGKGLLVDIVSQQLEAAGYSEYAVDASGDIRIRGATERIGLENPYDPSSVLGLMTVSDASLCASAINRRAWGDWHHVVDPRTAKPVSGVIATWVVANETMIADGLATALFFVPAHRLQNWDFQYVRLLIDGRIEHSDNFVGELYI